MLYCDKSTKYFTQTQGVEAKPDEEKCPDGKPKEENGDCLTENFPGGSVKDKNGKCPPEKCPDGKAKHESMSPICLSIRLLRITFPLVIQN